MSLQADRIALQERMIAAQVWQCCMNCMNWGKHTELIQAVGAEPVVRNVREGCMLAAYAVPPARVLAVGCNAWEADIPF